MKQQKLVSSVGCTYFHEGRCYSELEKGSVLCELFDKYFGTHKFELVPIYESPREKFIKAIMDLTPKELQKVKEYCEFLHFKKSLNNSTN